MPFISTFLASWLTVCPGTEYRYCGDKTPVAYVEAVSHGPGHQDSANPSREPSQRPDRPSRPDPDPDPGPDCE